MRMTGTIDQVCPNCGNSLDGTPPDICSPMRCDAWTIEAQFDHVTREWVHPKVWERLQAVRAEQDA